MRNLQKGSEWFLFVVYFVIMLGVLASTVGVGLYELACAAGYG
jgi:hypothetical protein